MRGKHTSSKGETIATGLIPAHAGKTPFALRPWYRRSAHPRACGENLAARDEMATRAGSSPRMRGKRQLASQRPCFRVAHPRACGENSQERGAETADLGSSPRMRGKRVGWASWLEKPRLIPAHAGKTLSSSAGRRRNRAHPRACGENRQVRASR